MPELQLQDRDYAVWLRLRDSLVILEFRSDGTIYREGGLTERHRLTTDDRGRITLEDD